MSRDNPWTQHRQLFWQTQAGNPSLPLWLRMVCLAYGVHRRNGHAPFEPGGIAIALSHVDPATGEIVTPIRQNIARAVAVAVEYGFLDPASWVRCLVVPRHAVTGGLLGREDEACRHHEHKQASR